MLLLLYSLAPASRPELQTAALQKELAGQPVGERIAFWADRFVGTPYDEDPVGGYVRRKVIVADDRVDCMYLTFRAVELGLGKNPADSRRIALRLRFLHRGVMENGKVVNYEDRFQYGEDMIDSGKWGREITSGVGENRTVAGPSGKETTFVPGGLVLQSSDTFKSGDIVFFVNPPEKIAGGVIIGHIGIIKKETDKIYLIHASGKKERGGSVKKVLLRDYLSVMSFEGIKVTRFPSDMQMSE
jgi:hypothetical protein